MDTTLQVEDNPEKKGSKTKKRVVDYPKEVLDTPHYSLFLSIYRDRGNVEPLVAEAVKDLKVDSCTCVFL